MMAQRLAPLRYTALERVSVPRPVDRLAYLSSRVSGRRVFDLGALDETALEIKQRDDNWLHGRLCRQATSVVGIDNSTLVPEEGLVTAPNGQIIRADIFDLAPVVARFWRPDVIIAGELIEHLPDSLSLLQTLRCNGSLRGADFLFSTPNACAWHNVLVGLAGRESMHQDHLNIYSYKSLRTLFARADIELLELIPYHARFQEMVGRSGTLVGIGVRAFQRLVNTFELTAPMLSGGWIGVARL